jgi:peroxiredoxin
VDVWVFVPSSAQATQAYVQKHHLPYRMISDPERRIYRQYEIEEDTFLLGTLKKLSIQDAIHSIRLTAKHGHGLPEGSERQRIGAYLLDHEGKVRYRHTPASTLALFPLAELFAAVDALPPRKIMGFS